MEPTQTTRHVDTVMRERRSVRAFLPDAVPRPVIDAILETAAWAPSGNNIQPWRVHLLTGATLQQLVSRVCAAFDRQDGTQQREYDYYPAEFFEPYRARRRKLGWDLYGLLGIAKGDTRRMQEQVRRNFEFFGAPVGLIFTVDRRLGRGSWIDYGMFLQNLMLAAQARGLGSCAQAAWIDYHRIITDVLSLPVHEQVVCGMALGYPDPAAVVNRLQPERCALDEFVTRYE